VVVDSFAQNHPAMHSENVSIFREEMVGELKAIRFISKIRAASWLKMGRTAMQTSV